MNGDDVPTFDPRDPFMKAAYQLMSLLKDDKDWKEALLQFIKARTRLIEAETLTKLQRIRTPKPL